MRKYILLSLLILSVACTKHEGYSVVGNVPEAWEGKNVYLTIVDGETPLDVDSATISNGKFKLQGTFETPRYCALTIFLDDEDRGNRDKIVSTSLFVDNSAVQVAYDTSSKGKLIVEIDNKINREYTQVIDEVTSADNERRKIFSAYTSAYYGEKDLPKAIELAKEHKAKQEEIRAIRKKYIEQNPQSVVSIKLVTELVGRNSDLTKNEVEEIYSALSPELQATEMGQALRKTIDSRNVFVGEPFVDYTLVTPNGEEKRISDYVLPGKTTLIEFWASWCAPCIEEIPYMTKTYNQYHSKGFNILSISIDSDKNSWLKALEKEQLPWEQLLDQKSESFKKYNFTGVPSSVLIDENGNVLQFDARGAWLDAAMQAIYDK